MPVECHGFATPVTNSPPYRDESALWRQNASGPGGSNLDSPYSRREVRGSPSSHLLANLDLGLSRSLKA
jgi:hypothetical protein